MHKKSRLCFAYQYTWVKHHGLTMLRTEEIQLHAPCYLCRDTWSSFCADCVIPGKIVLLSTVKERVYTLQTVWRRRRREPFNSGIITRQPARSRSPCWAIQVTDDDDDSSSSSSSNNNNNNNWHYTRQFSILYKSPSKQERSTMKYNPLVLEMGI